MNKIRRIISVFALAVLLLPLFCLFPSASEQAVSVSVTVPKSVTVGSELRVKIEISKPAFPLAGLEFSLSFDDKLVKPKITDNKNQRMDAFSKKVPKGWEQMHSFSEKESKYYLRFAMPENGEPLKDASALSVEIPFAVTGTGVIGFSADSDDIVAVKNDKSLTLCKGAGSSCSSVSAGEKDTFSVTLSGDEEAVAKSRYEVTAKVTNLCDRAGIAALEFALSFDGRIFEPVITENKNAEMDVFMSRMPHKNWEQMCSYDAEKQRYVIRLACLSAGEKEQELLKLSDSLEIKIPFRVRGSEGDTGGFSVVPGTVVGANADVGKVSGTGGSFSVPVTERETFVIPSYLKTDGKYIFGTKPGTPVSEYEKSFGTAVLLDRKGNRVKEGFVGTGMRIAGGENQIYIIVIKGDCSGEGKITSADYAMAKRICLNTYDAGKEIILSAKITDSGENVSVKDYAMLKRHVLGTYNIYGSEK